MNKSNFSSNPKTRAQNVLDPSESKHAESTCPCAVLSDSACSCARHEHGGTRAVTSTWAGNTRRVSAQGRAPSKSKGARPFGERPLSEGRAPVLMILMSFSPKIQKKSVFLNRSMIFIGHCHP